MYRTPIILIGLLLVLPTVAAASTDATLTEDVPYVVRFSELPAGLQRGDLVGGARVASVDEALGFAVLTLPRFADVQSSLSGLRSVLSIDADPKIQLIEMTPNDPMFSQQYGPQQVRAPLAWDTATGAVSTKLCVVDTGVRHTHEDIAGPRWLGGYDFENNDNDPMDDNGHGTHVTGTAAATTGNALGIAGVAQVGILGVKALDAKGSGSLSNVASGIRWCADNGADIISLSLGSPSTASVMHDAVKYAANKGVLVIAAAGNDGQCTYCVNYPAAYPEVVAVTCTTSSRTQCSFSSEGPEAEIAAPGSQINAPWMTGDRQYKSISGTSMSTPHVAGVAALVKSHMPAITAGQLRQVLRDSAQDLGPSGFDVEFGYGLVDAAGALALADGRPLPEPTPAPEPEPAPEPGPGPAPGPGPSEPVAYEENFDDGRADGWNTTGLWHISADCARAYSGIAHMGYHRVGACDYETGAITKGAATFTIDLTPSSSAQLAFMTAWKTETALVSRDILTVEASVAGGDWTTLAKWDSRDANQLAWTEKSVDLVEFVGMQTLIRFVFDSVDADDNAFAGWYLDDVRIFADDVGATPGPAPGEPAPPPVPVNPNAPPTAVAGDDITVADPDGDRRAMVHVDGSASNDTDGSIVSYEWRIGARTVATGPVADIEVGSSQTTIDLVVVDNGSAAARDSLVVTLLRNEDPTARFTAHCDGQNCTFDATASTDPDGPVVTYEWRIGRDRFEGAVVTHRFAEPDEYRISLTVQDEGRGRDRVRGEVLVMSDAARRVFSEDFEAGGQGWNATADANNLWRVGADCAPADRGNVLAFNRPAPSCDHDVGRAAGGMVSPVIDLRNAESAYLRFAHNFEVDDSARGSDTLRVEVSDNGGRSWRGVETWYTRDTPDGWQTVTLDLTRRTGDEIQLRFWFDSRNARANDAAGWSIDDVEILAW